MMGSLAAGNGDRVSGDALSPCANLTPAEKFAARQIRSEPVGEVQRYGRMLRPFPTRRLTEVLYHVEADSDSLIRIVRNLLVDPPQTADTWCEALYHLLDVLDSICERAIEARPHIERMIDTADADAERAAIAMRAIVSVIEGPAPCPTCGGTGGDHDGGHCGLCQGTAIDPNDPLSPL